MADQANSTLWLKNPLDVLADGDSAGGVVVRGKQIVELVPSGKVPVTAVDHVTDCSRHVIIPGLVNTHHHFYQTLTRTCPSCRDQQGAV